MPKDELLPGVASAACPPRVVADAHDAIRSARRRSLVRDGLHLGLLIAVDWLFVHWADSRMPFLGRHASLSVLRVMNLGIFAHIWLARAMPKWTARRIAATWSRSEREKFRG